MVEEAGREVMGGDGEVSPPAPPTMSGARINLEQGFFKCEIEMNNIDTFVLEKCVTALKSHPEINFIIIYLFIFKFALRRVSIQ